MVDGLATIMNEYFTGHKDSVAINDYLNALPESSNDFQIVFRLRCMGEEFVDGVLSLDTVYSFAECLPASCKAEDFIRQMKCYTFFSALSSIALKQVLSPFEQRVKEEIEHPTFCKPVPSSGKVAITIYKLQRIWYTRWKHPLVFNEHWLPALVTWVWSVVRWERVVRD